MCANSVRRPHGGQPRYRRLPYVIKKNRLKQILAVFLRFYYFLTNKQENFILISCQYQNKSINDLKRHLNFLLKIYIIVLYVVFAIKRIGFLKIPNFIIIKHTDTFTATKY